MSSILLVGKTGSGKSATGNSILRNHVFRSILSPQSVTKHVGRYYAKFNGREIKVVDCPGLMDTDCSLQESAKMVSNAILQAVAISPEGYDAILLVCEMGRFTKEDADVMIQLKAFFGDDFLKKHCIIAVTHADEYDKDEEDGRTIEEWVSKQDGPFADARQECCERVITFDNVTAEKATQDVQISKLLEYVDNIVSQHGRYNQGLFEQARSTRERCIEQMDEPVLSEEANKDLQLLMEDIKRVDVDNHESARKELEDIERQTLKLKDMIKLEDRDTGKLKSALAQCDTIIQLIDGKREALENNIKRKQMVAKSEAMTKEEKEEHDLKIRKLEEKHSELVNKNKSLETKAENENENLTEDKWLFALRIISILIDIGSGGLSIASQSCQIHSFRTGYANARTGGRMLPSGGLPAARSAI